jgi:hypothetical protein
LETPVSVLNPVACVRREIPKELITVAYHPTLLVSEILPSLKTILGLRFLSPIHLQPARRARRYLFLPSGVHLAPAFSMFGQKLLLIVGHIVPSYTIRIGNPNECKRACN